MFNPIKNYRRARRLRKHELEERVRKDEINRHANELIAQGWAPLTAACKVKVEPACGYRVRTRQVFYSQEDFRTKATGGWSTTGGSITKRALWQQAFRRDNTRIVFDSQIMREQLEHWLWLAHNPRLAKLVIKRHFQRKQNLLDSALFL